MTKKILLVGDLVGYGRLAISAQASVLTPKGYSVAYLPTALVSNNFCYQQYAMLDTTEYMRQSIATWQQLGFNFDVVSIGFIASDEQAAMLSTFCQEQKKRGAIIVVDPIMADNGRLYSGIGADTIDRLRRMVSLADIVLPNYTEACYLTDTEFHSAGLQAEETRPLVDRMLAMGAKSVLVTSCRVGEQPCVIGFDAEQQQYMQIPYREVPVFFSGTGDIFSARLIATLLSGRSLQAAAVITMEKLSALIDTYQYEENKNEGIPY